MRRAPYVDMVFGPQSYHNLPELVANALRGQKKNINLDFSPEPKFDFLACAVRIFKCDLRQIRVCHCAGRLR